MDTKGINRKQNAICLEEADLYYANGTFNSHIPTFLEEVKTLRLFETNSCYNYDILKSHLKHVQVVYDSDDITSFISRYIKHNFELQLRLFFNNIDKLKKLPCHNQYEDNYLFLRRIKNIDLYILSKQYGYIDPELEKRFSLFTKICKRQLSNKKDLGTSCPKCEDYSSSNRYYGYRHVCYYLKWRRYEYKCILHKILTE